MSKKNNANAFTGALLSKVKKNLILQHDEDDEFLAGRILAAVNYAESYQHIPAGTYANENMPPIRRFLRNARRLTRNIPHT